MKRSEGWKTQNELFISLIVENQGFNLAEMKSKNYRIPWFFHLFTITLPLKN